MNIVIAGAGEVGSHLAEMLSNENQEISLMDANEKLLMTAAHKLEVLPVVGQPTLISDLEEAAVGRADLFISVMPDESANLMACLLAKKLGVKKTIARINNHEYLNLENLSMFEDLGIDSMIYPEELAANEIVSTIHNPWARQYVELFNGAMVLVAVKTRAGAPIVGKTMMEISNSSEKTFHVVAIHRDMETIIPTGSTKICHNDLVYFTAIKKDLHIVQRLCGKENIKIKKMVIMGASPIALRTIDKLPEEVEISLIEIDKEKCMALSDKLPSNVKIYHGDGRDLELIKEVGYENAQAFVALTGNSEINILACLAAKRYNVAKTIAKEENIDYITLAYRLDIGTLINKKLLAAGYIYRMLWGQVMGSVVCLSLINNAEVAELIVDRNSTLLGKTMKEISLPEAVTFGGLIRNGIPKMISGDTVFETFDHVVVFYHNTSIDRLREIFN